MDFQGIFSEGLIGILNKKRRKFKEYFRSEYQTKNMDFDIFLKGYQIKTYGFYGLSEYFIRDNH